jgi:hypothetical protein
MAALTYQSAKNITLSGNVEKDTSSSLVDAIPVEGSTEQLINPPFWSRLYDNGLEFHGGAPIPVEAQTNTSYLNVFTVYSTSMFSLLP